MHKHLALTAIAKYATKVMAMTLPLAISLLISDRAVTAQEPTVQDQKITVDAEMLVSSIQPPTSSENIGAFNKIAYVRRQGRFVGQTANGRFEVPYEITLPSNPDEGNGILVFEPPHFLGGAVGRDFYLSSQFLFERGFSHASVGYSNVGMRMLNSNPGFTPVIKDQPISPFHTDAQTEVTDTDILRQFTLALKQDASLFPGKLQRIYAAGFSDSGNAVRSVYEPFGHRLFDLTFVCTSSYSEPVKIAGQNPIIVINMDVDFNVLWVPYSDFPQSRWYAVAGAPHASISGTTPINWLPFARSLFIAGDEWSRNGTLPPASGKLNSPPDSESSGT
jgi:Alpha/beta hydrolase domain